MNVNQGAICIAKLTECQKCQSLINSNKIDDVIKRNLNGREMIKIDFKYGSMRSAEFSLDKTQDVWINSWEQLRSINIETPIHECTPFQAQSISSPLAVLIRNSPQAVFVRSFPQTTVAPDEKECLPAVSPMKQNSKNEESTGVRGDFAFLLEANAATDPVSSEANNDNGAFYWDSANPWQNERGLQAAIEASNARQPVPARCEYAPGVLLSPGPSITTETAPPSKEIDKSAVPITAKPETSSDSTKPAATVDPKTEAASSQPKSKHKKKRGKNRAKV